MEYYITRITSIQKLRREILEGRYKIRPGSKVVIYRPKKRVANAPWFKDRVWQRSMCNNGVYEDLTGSFIMDNIACQKGKGLDMAIRRVIKMLQRIHHLDPEGIIWGTHLDIKGYFPNTPHKAIKEMDLRKITEPEFIPYLNEIIDSQKDERPEEEISADPFGERGTGLGSQINQLHQVALLDGLDHELKTFCKYYIRYNDDFLILDSDKNTVIRARETVKEYLERLGLAMTDKTGIFNARNGFEFLRKRFFITSSGKIIIKMHKKALSDERRTLRGLKRYIDRGLRTMEDVRAHYQSWVANASYAGMAPIRAMDKFYTELFREHPIYKLEKRYLYGKRSNSYKKRKNQASRKRKQKAD